MNGVQGNTNANGDFSIRLVGGSLNRFALVGTRGNGEYEYGGEWVEDLEQGRILRATRRPGAITITSPGHGLQDGDRVAIDDRRGGVGFAEECAVAIPTDDARAADQFLLVGVAGAPGRPDGWGSRWRLVSRKPGPPRRGPTQGGLSWVSAPRSSVLRPRPPLVVESKGHGVLDGDHVLIENVVANTAANGLFTVTVASDDRDVFTLDHAVKPLPGQGSGAPSPNAGAPRRYDREMRDAPKAGGRWRVVRDQGSILGASNTKGKAIEITSPRHGLRPGQHVEINGVRGNTRANGVFTVSESRDDDRFTLDIRPGDDNPAYAYRSGGAWRLAPEVGRVDGFRVAGGKILIRSTSHRLKPGTHVRIKGLDNQRPGGVFAVRPQGDNEIELLGAQRVLPAGGGRGGGGLSCADEDAGTAGSWRVTYDRGPFTRIEKAPGRAILVHSPLHGLESGDHVMITDQAWAPAGAIFAVGVDDRDEPEGKFRLLGTEGIQLPRNVEGLTTSDDAGGEWQLVSGRGGIVTAEADKADRIVVVSPAHGLRDKELVEITGPSWASDQGLSLGLFTVMIPEDGADPDRFALRGTEGPLFKRWGRGVSAQPDHEGSQSNDEASQKAARGGLLGEWRHVARPGVLEPIMMTGAERLEGGEAGVLRFESPGHPLLVGDRVRIERVWSKARDPKPDEDAKPVPSERANGTFRVDEVTPDHFQVAIDKSWPRPPSGRPREFYRGEWRRAPDEGIVEADAAPGVPALSTKHGLATGARIIVQGSDRIFRVVVSKEDGDHFTLLPEDAVKRGDHWRTAELLDDKDLLVNWEARWAKAWKEKYWKDVQAAVRPEPGLANATARELPKRGKPKLAIVSVSGGGIRSAIWTTQVLECLEKRIPELPYHIRIVTGASGGMLGAGSFVASLQRPDDARRHVPPLATIVDRLGSDFLKPVANQMVFSDLPLMFYPRTQLNDRGLVLEKAWVAGAATCGANILDGRFRDLSVGEWEGWRPSLVFTPMLVEDGRRMLISNVNLDYAPRNIGHVLLPADTRKLSQNSKLARSDLKEGFDIFSLSAVEFFRIFPEAWDFRLSTGVRMSAAFPLITPAVSLPTIPSRRVVDAGYYDNYGVNLASLWLFQNHEWLMEHTSGVVLIQIRDFQAERSRRELNSDPELNPAEGVFKRLLRSSRLSSWLVDRLDIAEGNTGRGSQWLTSPLEGASAARYSITSFRNDEQVEALSNLIHFLKPTRPVRPGFYTTVVFECPKEASLSWSVTRQEIRDIRNGFNPNTIDPSFSDAARKNVEKLSLLQSWWK